MMCRGSGELQRRTRLHHGYRIRHAVFCYGNECISSEGARCGCKGDGQACHKGSVAIPQGQVVVARGRPVSTQDPVNHLKSSCSAGLAMLSRGVAWQKLPHFRSQFSSSADLTFADGWQRSHRRDLHSSPASSQQRNHLCGRCQDRDLGSTQESASHCRSGLSPCS